jgi:hypothetical protein
MSIHNLYNAMTFSPHKYEAIFLREAYEKNKAHKRVHWVTSTGTKIPVGDLGDAHLKNIAKFLLRIAVNFQQSIPFPAFQGEMASYYGEQEYERWTEADPETVACWLIGKRAIAVFLECEDRDIEVTK